MSDRVGKLLIAHPNLPGDNWFHRTVIYIYNDSPQQGTLGITLNVPTNIPFKKLCYDKGIIYPSEYPVVHKGGPVSESSIVILHTDEWNSRNTIPAGPRYRLSSDTEMFSKKAVYDREESIIELFDSVTIKRGSEIITGDYGILDINKNAYKVSSKKSNKVKAVITNTK